LKEIKPAQYGTNTAVGVEVRMLGVAIDGPVIPQWTINPFRYNSSNPTNNVNTFDLWVDIVVGGKTNRINNWSDKPTIL